MTVSASAAKAGPYTGNDIVSTFAFAFKVFADGDIRVVTQVDGLETDLVLNTDYTVSRNADQDTNPGGTVTYKVGGVTTALPGGTTLTIVGDYDYAQPTDLPNGGSFFASVVETALDRVTMLAKQLKERVDSALTLPVSVDGVSAELPVPEAGKVLGWNDDGTELENLDASTLASIVAFGTANADVFDGDGVTTQFTLSGNPGALGNLDVSIGGVTQTPTADYTWASGTTITFTAAPPSGTGNILVRYLQALPQGTTEADLVGYDPGMIGDIDRMVEDKLRESVSIADFGADNTGVAAVDTEFAAAIAALDSRGGGVLYVPPGLYRFTSTLTINKPSIVIRGAGSGSFLPTVASARADAATRFIFENAGVAVHFTPVEDAPPLVRSGITDVFIDCNDVATVGLKITTTRHGIFQNLTIYSAVNDQILTDCYAGHLQNGNGYDVQHCHFENISTWVSSSNTTAHSLRLTGGQGNGGTAQGNTSSNYFANLHLRGPTDVDCVILEDTDNNQFHWLRANGGSATPGSPAYAVVFGSADQDSGPLGAVARHNQIFGLIAVGGLVARASQTGDGSSNYNVVHGYSRSDGAPAPIWEAGAGGSDDGDMIVTDTYGRLYYLDEVRLRSTGVIDFADASGAIADSRTVEYTKLDLYEYGTLAGGTVTVEGGTSAGSGSYSVATGYYTRIGRMCHVTITVTWTGHTGTGDLIVNGLPFTAVNDSSRTPVIGVSASNLTFSGQISAYPEDSTKRLKISSSTSGSAIANVQMDAAATLNIAGWYTVA